MTTMEHELLPAPYVFRVESLEELLSIGLQQEAQKTSLLRNVLLEDRKYPLESNFASQRKTNVQITPNALAQYNK
jgi:hypothetical protein